MDVIVEGKALLDSGLTACCIGIDDGKIVKIAKTIERADKRLDLSDLMIIPAGVDLHVHFREPGMTQKEDFETGSMAAAAGGVAFVLEMPNTKPPTRSSSDILEKIKTASKRSYVDFGIAALLDGTTKVEQVGKLAMAFKMYIGETTGGLGIGSDDLPRILKSASRENLPMLIHAEHIGPLEEMEEKNLADHDRRRSPMSEMKAVKSVIDSKPLDGKIHLLHITQAEIIEMVKSAGMTTEITPHHLLLDTECGLGTRGKINPPLRSRSTRMNLWEAFVEGLNDTLGSDHSPHTIAEKEEDFDAAPSGMPGVETLIPLMLKKVADRKLDIQTLTNSISKKPAEIIGLKKGRLKVGYDADFIVVDLKRVTKIHADKLHSKCGWTPYEGMEAVFPALMFVRGEEIARNGSITGEKSGRSSKPGAEKK